MPTYNEAGTIQSTISEANEKMGSLVFFASDLETQLASINLYNLGIFSLQLDTTTDPMKPVIAGLYCERMEFQVGANP